MIKRAQSRPEKVTENMRGGPGSVKISALATPEELLNKGRLFSVITLEPGCGIGTHEHLEETELFYVLEGEADYNDNGVMEHLMTGDVTPCPPRECHGVTNNSGSVTKLIALILYR